MIEIVRKAFSLFTTQQKNRILVLVFISLVGAVMESVAVALVYPLMSLILGEGTGDSGIIDSILAPVLGLIGNDQILMVRTIFFWLAGTYLVLGLWRVFQQYVTYRWLAQIRTHLAGKLFKNFLNRPYSYHLSHSTAEIQRTVTEDVTRVMTLVSGTIEIASTLLTSASICVALVLVNPVVTMLILLISLGAILGMNQFLANITQRLGKSNQESNTRVNKWIYQATGSLKNVLVNREQQFFVNQYAVNARNAAMHDANYSILNVLPKFAVQYGGLGLIFLAIGAISSNQQDITKALPMLATFAMAAMKLFPCMSTISNNLSIINYRKANVNAVCELMSEDKKGAEKIEQDVVCKLRVPNKAQSLSDGIKVEGITFSFNDAEAPLYSDLSLTIRSNHSLAFVLTTFSVKTTLADIILGLHVPDKGRVLVDGKDIAENKEWWADQVGYIPQSIYLCDDTIRANVAFACEAKDVKDQDVWRALEEAQMKTFVEGLPNGLDTVVGENGVRLSGGQKQRIGIARALFRNPSVLVMDEATSALDGETEKAIIEAVENLSGKRTMLIIAHRLATIKNCDIIYRIEHGIVVREK